MLHETHRIQRECGFKAVGINSLINPRVELLFESDRRPISFLDRSNTSDEIISARIRLYEIIICAVCSQRIEIGARLIVRFERSAVLLDDIVRQVFRFESSLCLAQRDGVSRGGVDRCVHPRHHVHEGVGMFANQRIGYRGVGDLPAKQLHIVLERRCQPKNAAICQICREEPGNPFIDCTERAWRVLALESQRLGTHQRLDLRQRSLVHTDHPVKVFQFVVKALGVGQTKGTLITSFYFFFQETLSFR